jgi:Holliday junction resolvase-like predicted endonuclease
LQTRQYSQNDPTPPYLIARIVVETLKQTRGDRALNRAEVADLAKTTTEQVKRILGLLLDLKDSSNTKLTNSTRFKLAFEAVKLGALQQVARALTWQEFEEFAEECLQSVGFDTRKGVVVKDDSRRWQIDVIAKKGSMVLAVDCKHWESPAYDSKLTKAAEHQKSALQALFRQMTLKGEVGKEGILGLPVILTLFEPRSRLANGAVAVSVERFADFLEGTSPYSSELPFVPSEEVTKSSIK